ncbi:PREDICTED: DNA topoisomerase 2 [Dufourea novaeangliae]|uniref:DNA topoisomerase 2 n=1 Tax=Dufourea novaeangliae TaxID=178035 RepID=A0A154PL90_DUFNO|nr:PREDICTED: DNA topoisomerase 2 [Dufourea novaeangliae]XP_015435075.1 PREDICTED: DNA topoisomerase 2 [Dufourea novaeangliae]KZC12629.1 DNA topoisomerase 2 [Dufourea novaeangliae]
MSKAVENGGGDNASKKKTIEGIYQKKSQLEHILLRPDTYIGSVEPVTELMWIYDKEKEAMIQREIKYVPGLYKIFDEILVNAADNKQRDPKMDMIKIEIDQENNVVSVWNNGKGIPVVIHKEENMFVPTMIFGHLLTSSNYDDEEEKVTGGRNGYGAKLCNIFSHRFTVETASKEYKKCLKQTWSKNMGLASEPRIKEFSGEDFTKVVFSPDLSKFKMQSLDDDIVALMSRRAFDIAASSRGVKVFLNGTRIRVKNFKDYVELYVKGKEDDMGNPLKVIYEACGPRWEVAITLSDRGFQQMSFVNSIATTKGGRHVDHVTELIVKQLTETLKKKNKGGVPIKPFQIKNHLWIFVNCLINNPTFDSQTKENMTLQAKSFGSKCTLTDKFFSSVTKMGIVEAVLTWAKFKADSQLQKLGPKTKQRKLQGIPKLEDANDAGTVRSLECTLILTEGDSAKTMAVSGLSAIGRDKYGIFPLRGKILNVREATHKQILENAEINNLIKILGLQYKKKYESREDIKTLRYGKLMIMTDQDQDGSHIKGLLINFIHHNWPTLLRMNFVEEFITPIVKATKGSEVFSFFSLPEFQKWKSETNNFHTYKIKYYKGLGTSTAKEAKEYFQNMARHRIQFKYGGDQDDQNIIMAFSRKCADQRKDWLTNHMDETKRRKEIGLAERYLYHKDTRTVSYSEFINVELVLYSNYDNVRSIPSMMDGFKPGQRKVLFTCLKRNDKREVKVAQLAGSVAEHSAYHHGEMSLMSTIIGLAQNFVGSNNINLLLPNGQFGTRLTGGKDAASPRYIFTMLSPLTKFIFHKHDEPLLKYEYDDNQKIEPIYYVPVIPMVLVNGADGIGTGWMTKIPNFNPKEIIENLVRMMDGTDIKPMLPYYKNFKGLIETCGDYRYVINGEITVIGPDKVEITELPIGTWTQTYKENVLEPMLHGTDKIPPIITDYKEYNTDTAVHFVVIMNRDKLVELEREGLHKAFKLQTTTSITSMCAFDESQCLIKYENIIQILKGFYKVRLDMYSKRKDYLEGLLQAESDKLSNQARFILEKCDGTIVIENKKKKDMIAELIKRDYKSDPVVAWKLALNKEEVLEEIAENAEDEAAIAPTALASENFDYLLGMTLWSLTKEKKDDLVKQRDEKLAELKRLQNRTSVSLWKEDLENLLNEMKKLEEQERKEEQKMAKNIKKPPTKFYSSENIRRIVPMINDELKKKIERADTLSKDKKEGIKRPRVKKESVEEKDEFDNLVDANAKSLEDRLGSSTEKGEKKVGGKRRLKQTKLSFKAISKKEKKRDSDSDSASDDDIDFGSISPPPEPRKTSRRAANTKKNYSLSDASLSDDDFLNNHSSDSELKKKPVSSDSDDSFKIDRKALPPQPTSEELFDSLIGNPSRDKQKPVISSSEDSMFSPPAKVSSKKKTENGGGKGAKKQLKTKAVSSDSESEEAATVSNKQEKVITLSSSEDSTTMFSPPPKVSAKKKAENGGKKGVKRQLKKKVVDSDSDSEGTMFSGKQHIKKKRKKSESEQDDSVSETSPLPPPRTTGGRARKPVSYAVKSDDDDSN